MTRAKKADKPNSAVLQKSGTGIEGFDQITGGGLPRGRPTLVCGSAGCGKTLFAMEFLVQGALEYDEPGVFMAFEETPEELAQNVASLGFDLDDLVARRNLVVDHVHVERSEIEETGEYDLDGLFVRLGFAIDSVGAKRVVLDTLEALFGGLPNEAILRAELRRLFRWLKEKGVTAIITAERGEGALTRHGLEEYVSDCVILLDHRVTEQISTRRLRVVKYRGSVHGTNEYPFLIGKHGISVMPVTSLGLDHKASSERISTGVPRLDAMLGGRGVYRGSSILLSGTAGTGKSSLSAHFARASGERGERCLYFAFEEAMSQILRNMRSIGIDLQPWVRRGLLQFHATRPTAYGLEAHLATIHKMIDDYRPSMVVFDPLTNLVNVGSHNEVHTALVRLIDLLKVRQVTGLFTSLTRGEDDLERTEVGISSLMDTWILLKSIESNGERNRGIYVLKSRGMAHSNQIREFRLTNAGIELTDVYLGPEGVLTGSARASQEAKERAEALTHRQEVERIERELERRRAALEAQITILRREFEAEEEEMRKTLAREQLRMNVLDRDRAEIAHLRRADVLTPAKHSAGSNGKGGIRENGSQKGVGKTVKGKRQRIGK
ncbi:MAG: circadian clock protein KaiC [Acidobacteriaceae bacterium]|nr:circadian clock protein KaiC [Acidobacteriaceae bacterium]